MRHHFELFWHEMCFSNATKGICQDPIFSPKIFIGNNNGYANELRSHIYDIKFYKNVMSFLKVLLIQQLDRLFSQLLRQR